VSHPRSVTSKRPQVSTPSYYTDAHPDLLGCYLPGEIFCGLCTVFFDIADRGSPLFPAPAYAKVHTSTHTLLTPSPASAPERKNTPRFSHWAPSVAHKPSFQHIRRRSNQATLAVRHRPVHMGCAYAAGVGVANGGRGEELRVERFSSHLAFARQPLKGLDLHHRSNQTPSIRRISTVTAKGLD